jgi:hypothetical protein
MYSKFAREQMVPDPSRLLEKSPILGIISSLLIKDYAPCNVIRTWVSAGVPVREHDIRPVVLRFRE